MSTDHPETSSAPTTPAEYCPWCENAVMPVVTYVPDYRDHIADSVDTESGLHCPTCSYWFDAVADVYAFEYNC